MIQEFWRNSWNSRIQWILFNGWVIFHGVYVPQLPYPFFCWWASRLLPCSGYYKQCCDEHWGARVSFRSGFLSVDAQEWDCWVIRQFYFQFFKASPRCSPQWLCSFGRCAVLIGTSGISHASYQWCISSTTGLLRRGRAEHSLPFTVPGDCSTKEWIIAQELY